MQEGGDGVGRDETCPRGGPGTIDPGALSPLEKAAGGSVLPERPGWRSGVGQAPFSGFCPVAGQRKGLGGKERGTRLWLYLETQCGLDKSFSLFLSPLFILALLGRRQFPLGSLTFHRGTPGGRERRPVRLKHSEKLPLQSSSANLHLKCRHIALLS